MTRYAHFIGSLPAPLMTGDADVMEWFATRVGDNPVTAIPCDIDADWIIQYLRDRADHLDVLKVVHPGDFDGYADMRTYGVRRGRKLTVEQVSMNRGDRIRGIVGEYRKLQEQHPGLKDVKIQISQPSPLDMALFVFAGAAVADGMPMLKALRHPGLLGAAIGHLGVFTEAVVAEVSELTAEHGDVLRWQLETPTALIAMVKAASLVAQYPVSRLLSRQLADILQRMHAVGADTVLHLCYGNYRRKALLAPHTLEPAVKLLNPTARLLREKGVPLPPVHLPAAWGSLPAPLEPVFYAALRDLNDEWPLIAGVVLESSTEHSIGSLRLFEQAAGRPSYGVATTCGLGRCTVAEADAAVTATVATAAAE